MLMRPMIQQVIEQLVDRHASTSRVDLNDIAEVIGDRGVSYEEVEHIISQLGDRGCEVGGPPTARELSLLQQVLVAARKLRAELGRAPTVEEIAQVSKLQRFVVMRALENGGALGGSASEPVS